MEMTVTLVEPFRGTGGRYAIYLNDEFAFVLYKGELSRYGLEEGIVMDDALYERILNETLRPRAKKRAMNLLQRMDRTEADLRGRLSDGGYPPEAVDDAIEYLKSFHYIDDMRYALEYIGFKVHSMSRKMIISKLSAKGIAKNVIEKAFEQHENELGTDVEGIERKTIVSIIDKRCPGGVDRLGYADKQKLFAYLYGKGFSASSIESAYNSMLRDG